MFMLCRVCLWLHLHLLAHKLLSNIIWNEYHIYSKKTEQDFCVDALCGFCEWYTKEEISSIFFAISVTTDCVSAGEIKIRRWNEMQKKTNLCCTLETSGIYDYFFWPKLSLNTLYFIYETCGNRPYKHSYINCHCKSFIKLC